MKKLIIFCSLLIGLSACNDYLDKDPISSITPENYFTTSGQLDTYVLDMYEKIITFPYTMNGADRTSDDKVYTAGEEPLFAPGNTRVEATGGDWDFGNIQRCNYFFSKVNPKYSAGSISGTNVEYPIGEMHFLRAYEYFKKLKSIGDFPIITEVQGMNYAMLEENSKRSPRCSVARFILADLDSAINMLPEASIDGNGNRLCKDAVRIFKSRVALFEGSWEKNFAGTAFVPNGTNWPGADQNPDFEFKAGSAIAEVDWFLSQAVESSKAVIDDYPTLTKNTGTLPTKAAPVLNNPYFEMYSMQDLSSYPEIILWRSYSVAADVRHNESTGSSTGNFNTGCSRSLVESFLCKDGLPIYASPLYQEGVSDDYIKDLVVDRDNRLQLFLQVPGDTCFTTNVGTNPSLANFMYSPLFHASWGNKTGYSSRKYHNYDQKQSDNGYSDTGRPIMRTVEAYLNYIEAYYLLNNTLDATATLCWKKIRTRAKVSDDFDATVAATVMSKEKLDWGSYTAGVQVSSMMYNIRRERRCELASEFHRFEDLIRWRSMDQLISGGDESPYVPEGFKLWGPMKDWYAGTLKDGVNVSSSSYDQYICPYHINANHMNYNGYTWTMAHYLSPIAAKHFTMTSVTSGTTTIYQNPYWGTAAGSLPTSSY